MVRIPTRYPPGGSSRAARTPTKHGGFSRSDGAGPPEKPTKYKFSHAAEQLSENFDLQRFHFPEDIKREVENALKKVLENPKAVLGTERDEAVIWSGAGTFDDAMKYAEQMEGRGQKRVLLNTLPDLRIEMPTADGQTVPITFNELWSAEAVRFMPAPSGMYL